MVVAARGTSLHVRSVAVRGGYWIGLILLCATVCLIRQRVLLDVAAGAAIGFVTCALLLPAHSSVVPTRHPNELNR
jgi:hypothetical protein